MSKKQNADLGAAKLKVVDVRDHKSKEGRIIIEAQYLGDPSIEYKPVLLSGYPERSPQMRAFLSPLGIEYSSTSRLKELLMGKVIVVELTMGQNGFVNINKTYGFEIEEAI